MLSLGSLRFSEEVCHPRVGGDLPEIKKSAPFGAGFCTFVFSGLRVIWAAYVKGLVLYARDVCCIYSKIMQKYAKYCEIDKNT